MEFGMLLLTAFFSIVCIALGIKRVPIFRFDFLSSASWLFSVLVPSIGLISYDRSISFTTSIFIIACHSFLLLGFYSIKSKKLEKDIVYTPKVILQILVSLAIGFVLISTLRTLSEGSIPIIDAISSLEEARIAHWEQEVSTLTRITRIGSYAAVPYAVLLPILPRTKFFYAVWAVTALFLVEASLQEGGRALLVYLMIGIFSIFFTFRKVQFTRLTLIAIIGTFSAYFLAVDFYLQRNTAFAQNPDFFVDRVCGGGRLGPLVRSGPDSAKALAFSSCYFSMPVRNLDLMLRDWDRVYYGGYNFGVIARDTFDEARDDIEVYFKRRGEAVNPWATSVRDVWLDFRWLAPIAFYLFGLVTAYALRSRKTNNLLDVAIFGLIATSGFAMPFQSPLILRSVVYPFIMLLALRALIAFLQQKNRANRLSHARVPARSTSAR